MSPADAELVGLIARCNYIRARFSFPPLAGEMSEGQRGRTSRGKWRSQRGRDDDALPIPLWMDVPFRKRPASVGMTTIFRWSHKCGSGLAKGAIRTVFWQQGDHEGSRLRAPFVLRTFPPLVGETLALPQAYPAHIASLVRAPFAGRKGRVGSWFAIENCCLDGVW